MTLIGKQAPTFKAKAVEKTTLLEDFSLVQYQGKNVVFFFYPLDFTFVCPTELHAFQDKIKEFEARNTQVVACSVDSPFCHLAWLDTPKEKGGIKGVEYPIVSDINKKIAESFGVLLEEEGIALRGLFILDKEGIIRHATMNDLPLGRSVDETLRTLDALNSYELYGEVCPANWQPGKSTLEASPKGLEKYFAIPPVATSLVSF